VHKNNFVRDFILLFLLAFALTSLYDKVKIVFDAGVSGWNIHWVIMWQTIGSMFSGYPLVMATIMLVVVFALYFIWKDRKTSDDNTEIKELLKEIKGILENMRDGTAK